MPRRRVFLLALIALPLLALFGLAVSVETGLLDDWLVARVKGELESRIAGRVTLRAASFRLLPPRLTLKDLAIFPPADPGPDAAIQIETVRVDLWTVDAVGTRRTLGRVAVDGLRVRVESTPEGPLNLLVLRRDESARQAGTQPLLLRLGIGNLRLSNAVILYNDRAFRLDSSRGGLAVDGRFDSSTNSYRGELQLEDFSLRVGDLTLPEVTLTTAFEYFADDLRFGELALQSAGIRLTGAASIALETVPTFEVEVGELILNLGEIPALASANVAQGVVEVRGRARGDSADFSFEGSARSEQLAVFGEQVAALEADVEVDRNRLRVVEARWNHRQGPGRASGALEWSQERQSAFDFDVTRVNVPGLLTRLGWSFPLRGRGNAVGTVRWPGLDLGALQLDARAGLAGHIGTTSTPLAVEATSSVRLDRRTVLLSDGEVTAEGARITGAGQLDYLGNVNLGWSAEAESAVRFIAVAREAFGIALPPITDGFRLPAAGRVEGALTKTEETPFRIEGRLLPTDFDSGTGLQASLGGTFAWQPGDVMAAAAQLSGADFEANLEITRVLGLLPDHPRLGVTAEKVPLQPLTELVAPDLPVEGGRISGSFHSTVSSAALSGQLRVEGLAAAGQHLGELNASFGLIDDRVQVSTLQLDAPAGTVQGQLEYRGETGAIDADLRVESLTLQHFEALPRELEVQSLLSGSVRLSGVWPRIEGGFEFREGPLSVASRQLESFELTGTIESGNVRFSTGWTLAGQSVLGNGALSLGDPYPMRSRFELAQAELRPLLTLIGLPVPEGVEGLLSGTLTTAGPALSPDQWDVAFEFDQLQLAHEASTLKLDQPSSIRLQKGRLAVDRITLSDGSNRLGVSGSIDVASPPVAQLQVEGDVDLSILSALLEQGRARGRLSVERLDLLGPINSPRLVGRASVTAEAIQHPDLPLPLADVTADLRFTREQLSIEEFQASTRHGSFFASGGVFLEGFTPRRWQINAFGYGLTFDYPEGLNSRIDFDIDYSSSVRSRLLSGVVYVRAAEYAEEMSIADLVILATQPQGQGVASSGEDLTVLDLEVEAYRTIRINNNLADVIASGDFRLRGTVGNPVVLGDIVINEGRLRLDRNHYEVDRGTIRFDDPGATHPVVDLEVSTQVREYDVTLLLRGPVEQLRANVRSDPPLSTGEVVTLLATGDDPVGGTGLRRSGSLAAAGAGSLLSNTVGQQTSRLFGFDRFSVDPFIDSGERDPGARVTLGKQINRDLDVTYVTKLGGQLNRQAVIVQYRITRWLTGVGSGEQDGTVAIDFKIRKRF